MLLSILVFLLLLSVFFSASETAILSSDRAKIQKAKKEGGKSAGELTKLLDSKEHVISGILLGNNFVNIASSTIATAVALTHFGDSGETLALVTALMTFIIIIYCEILPKTFAVRNPESVALRLTKFCSFFLKIIYPINYFLQQVVKIHLKLFKMDGVGVNNISSFEIIKGTIEHHFEKGLVTTEDKYVIAGLIDLEQMSVGEVMVHRNEVKSVSIDDDIKNIINTILSYPFSRIPVWKDRSDNIIGIVHVKDVFKLVQKCLPNMPVKEQFEKVIRPPWFIPNTTNLKLQLKAFRDHHTHFALVVDEYGELQGLVTLEDIMEEVVGQIEDEHDKTERMFSKNSDGSATVKSELSIRDLNREMHWDLPEKTAATIGGLMFHVAQGIPRVGDTISVSKYRLRLIKKKHNKIGIIRVFTAGDK